MKYVITESQYKKLFENKHSWIKRRLNQEYLSKFIESAVLDFPNPCEDFGDEWYYADGIIRWAVDELMLSDKNDNWGEDYDLIFSKVQEFAEKLYLSKLIQKYKEMCHN